MSNQSSCRILKFLGMDVKCDKSSSTDEANLGVSDVQDTENTVNAKKKKVDGTVQTNEAEREEEREKKNNPSGDPSSFGVY